MFIIADLLSALAQVLAIVIQAVFWLILIRALISWINPDPYNAIVRFLYRTTEPILQPIRRLIPTENLGIDISPVIAILILIFLRHFLVTVLIDISLRLK